MRTKLFLNEKMKWTISLIMIFVVISGYYSSYRFYDPYKELLTGLLKFDFLVYVIMYFTYLILIVSGWVLTYVRMRLIEAIGFLLMCFGFGVLLRIVLTFIGVINPYQIV